MKLYDSDGWPVVRIGVTRESRKKNRFINFIRIVLHTDLVWTFRQLYWPDSRATAKAPR